MFDFLRENDISHKPGRYNKSGTMTDDVLKSGQAIVGCGTLPHHAIRYGKNNPFYLLERDADGKPFRLVRYTVTEKDDTTTGV